MEFITELWLPIILSAVFIFIVSSIMHMALPFHKNDMGKMDGEDGVLESMRANGVKPGAYMFPCPANMKDCGSPEMVEKRKQGPVGFLTVVSADSFNMGKSLMQWFIFILIACFVIAYASWHSLGGPAEYITVFRITGAIGVLAFALGVMNDSIWRGQAWSVTFKFMIDGVVYALVAAGTFGWLWPSLADNLPVIPGG
ncbi:MAG: hypothetical protein D8M59_15650 [Planctomycetes bacterium]|nr:hypothetical protein [Planctomycetota bacterium]NOG54907.1 hypothetical protein [Planctomycetota bacterium]